MSCPAPSCSGSQAKICSRSDCTMCPPPRGGRKCPEGIYVERVKSMKPNLTYVSSSAKFDGMSSYREFYVPKCGPRAISLKPAAQFFPSDAKFDGLSTYKETYTPKPLFQYQKPEWSKKAEFDPSSAKMEGCSTYRNDYTGCRGETVKSLKPLSTFDPSSAPMDGLTTYRTTFVDYCPRERGYAKQKSMKKFAGGDTSCAPFEGMSTYRGDFWAKPIDRVKSLKPTVRGAFSDAPFADRTTYRNDYFAFHFTKDPGDCIPADVYNATCPPELFCCQPDPPEDVSVNYNTCPTYGAPDPVACEAAAPCPACPGPDDPITLTCPSVPCGEASCA